MRTVQKSLISIIIISLTMAAGTSAAKPWSPGMYARFTYASFSKYKPARQRINVQNIDMALLHAAIFYETNRQRARRKLPVFKHSPALEAAAHAHSRDMVQRDFFSHKSPIKGKRTMKDRLRRVGIINASMAENIAYLSVLDRDPDRPLYTPEQNGGYFSYTWRGEPLSNHTYLSLAKTVLDRWMHSKGHRENILNGAYVYLGCGAAHYRDASFHNMDRLKVTQDFSSKDASKKEK